MFLLLSQAAWAATWSVDVGGGADFASIQEAIDAASSGDLIEVEAGLYAESISYSGKDVEIVAVDGPAVTVVDAMGAAERTVSFADGEGSGAALIGFTVHNGLGGAGIEIRNASPRLEGLILADLGYWEGGFGYQGDVGGAIDIDGGDTTILNCTFERNRALFGGAVAVQNGSITIEDCLFIENDVGSYGGAIWLQWGELTIRDSRFIENSALYGGGDVSALNADVIWHGSTSVGSRAEWYSGGSIELNDSIASISGGSFVDDFAPSGGCVYASRSDVDIQDVHFSGCLTLGGAGIEAQGYGSPLPPTFNMVRSEVDGAEDGSAGVGVGVYDYGTVTLFDSRFRGNARGIDVAGFNIAGDLEITDCDIQDSSSDGAYITDFNNVTISGSVFQNNGAKGLFMNAFGDVSVSDSAFCGNRDSNDAAVFLRASLNQTVWTRNVFRENRAAGGALQIDGNDNVDAVISFNDFIGNTADATAAVVRVESGDIAFSNNMMAYNGDGVVVRVVASYTGVSFIDENLWFGNGGWLLEGSLFGRDNFLDDNPGLGDTWDGNCPGTDLTPRCGSPLLEHGIGAFEGPDDCQDPSAIKPKDKDPNEKSGGCSTVGHVLPGLSGVFLSWVAMVRRRRRGRSR